MMQTNLQFSEGYCECIALYRKLCLKMLEFDTFLLHCAAIAVDGEGYLFTAKSGVGKSTHIRYWMELFGDRAVVINGDKPLIRFWDGKFYVCGTPWNGKENWGTNRMVPIKAICLLERGEDNKVMPVNHSEIVGKIFYQILRPQDPELAMKQMKLLDILVKTVSFYRLQCNQSIEAAQTAYEGLQKE